MREYHNRVMKLCQLPFAAIGDKVMKRSAQDTKPRKPARAALPSAAGGAAERPLSEVGRGKGTSSRALGTSPRPCLESARGTGASMKGPGTPLGFGNC